jgi:hypothetical protein
MPLWKPSEWDWPEYEPADLFWAKRALDWGQAFILARYLRETVDVDPLVLRTISAMIDPDLGPTSLRRQRWRLKFRWPTRGRPKITCPQWPISARDLADLLDPPESAQRWRLVFERSTAGNPGDPNLFWRQHALGMETWQERRQVPHKPSWAMEHGISGKGRSRPSKYRALKVLRGKGKVLRKP